MVGHLLLLLLLLLILGQGHVLLKVTGWKDVIDCILIILLIEMLLEELRNRVFNAFQIDQKGAVESLLGLWIQRLILMHK